MQASAQTQSEVMEAMKSFVDAYERRDIDKLMSTMIPDSDLFMYGTGVDEKRIGTEAFKAQAERDWAQTDSATFAFGDTLISEAGSVAWVAAEIEFQAAAGGQSMAVPLRSTVVLEKRDGKWLLAQMHVSTPDAGQQQGDSVPGE